MEVEASTTISGPKLSAPDPPSVARKDTEIGTPGKQSGKQK